MFGVWFFSGGFFLCACPSVLTVVGECVACVSLSETASRWGVNEYQQVAVDLVGGLAQCPSQNRVCV